jgi:hypothetical protein
MRFQPRQQAAEDGRRYRTVVGPGAPADRGPARVGLAVKCNEAHGTKGRPFNDWRGCAMRSCACSSRGWRLIGLARDAETRACWV